MTNYKDILLVGEDYIKSNTSINDNINGDYILPAIHFSQRQYLEETLGSALVRKIQQLIAEGNIDKIEYSKYKILLDDYIQDYLAYFTIADICMTTAFKVNNFGVTRSEDEKQYNITFDEVGKIKNYYQQKAEYIQYRMQRFLIANYADYPELVEYKTLADLQTNLYSAAGCGIWLGGARNKGYDIADRGDYLREKYNFPSK